MKIMSFNVKHIPFEDLFFKWKKRYINVVNFIKQEDPDILGMQEITRKGKKFLEKNLLDYFVIGESRNSFIFTNEYNPILIKKDYELISNNTFSLSENIYKLGNKTKNDKFPRICVVAHIKKDNKKYMIVNTHIDNSSFQNKKRLLDIYEKIIDKELSDDEYIILMGDYNMTIDNKNLKFFSKKYLDPFKDYKIGTFPALPNLKALDHIFIDKKLGYCDDKIYTDSNDRCFLSDHNPIGCSVSEKK